IGVIGVLALLAATGRLGAGFPVIGLLITGLPALSFLVTVQATRALLFAGLAVAGFVKLISAAGRARQTSTRLGLAISTLVSLAMVALAFFIQSEGDSRKIRIQLFTSLLLVTLAYSAGALASFLSSRRTTDEPHPELGAWTRVGGVVAVVGALVFAVIELADGGGVVFSFSTGLAKGALLGFGIYAVGTLYRLLFTRDGGIGRALVSVGTGSLMLALAAKMLFVTTVELDTIPGVTRFRVSVLFYLLFAAGGAWLLARTQFGSWTYAVGGNKDASRSVGVPAARTKTTLFMMTSAAAWVTGMVIAFRLNSVQADVGDGNEFRYIIVAVVGGNLLTGGYGSALGAAFGALIFGMITQGIGFAGWNTDWRFLVLGALLLIAVIVNNFVRQLAERSR
ncbi:MAG: ABC transporter permease, partial [Acidimicrobiales bacterium]